MLRFHLLLKTPDAVLLDIQAHSIHLRTSDGEMTIFAQYENTIMDLDVCIAEVVDENGLITKVIINGGILYVNDDTIIVSTTKGQIVAKNENIVEVTQVMNSENDLILNEVKQALELGGYFTPEMKLSTLLAEERIAKYELLKEIKG
jgi:F0F1-type ATP synthase epsilon subunit